MVRNQLREYRVRGSEFEVRESSGFKVWGFVVQCSGIQGLGFIVQGSRFRVRDSRFGVRVQSSRFRVQDSRFGVRVQSSGFRVQNSGFRFLGLARGCLVMCV